MGSDDCVPTWLMEAGRVEWSNGAEENGPWRMVEERGRVDRLCFFFCFCLTLAITKARISSPLRTPTTLRDQGLMGVMIGAVGLDMGMEEMVSLEEMTLPRGERIATEIMSISRAAADRQVNTGFSMEMNQTSRLQAESGEQCSVCDFREHSKQMRLHTIKSQILSILRLEQAPNISRDMIRQLLPKAPPLTQLLDQYDPRVEDEDHATTETIITMATKPNLIAQDELSSCCLFSLSPKIQPKNIMSAQLWVHLRPTDVVTTVFLQISRLKPGIEGNNTRVRVRSLKIDTDAGISSWQSIDIKSLLQAWLRQPETNYGIEINAYDSKGEDLAVTSAEPGEEGLQPFIEVKILDSPKRSRRDSGLNCDEESAETRCCRYPLTVDFEEFGWDWIIAPKRYRANYCSGDCEFMHLQQYPHAHLVNKANPRGTAGPCCTPSKMSPINMLYFNRKEQIIYGKIPSMVVDHCGCS